MLRTLNSYTDYWMHRKQFIAQYATATFMSYLFNVGHRTPHKITISRKNGNVWMTELLPGMIFIIYFYSMAPLSNIYV